MAGAVLQLPATVARHATQVLRLPVGASMVLFDGKGGEYPATLSAVSKAQASVNIGSFAAVERESPLQCRLIQALQSADKMDLTLQKAVELGVSALYPVSARRSVLKLDAARADKRLMHWQGVAIAAAEQCGRNRLPQIAAVQNLTACLSDLAPAAPAELRFILLPEASQSLSAFLPVLRSGKELLVTLLVGCEGGFDPDEENMALHAGFIPLRLGTRIMRTETAGLAALAALQTLAGDFI